MDEAKQLYKIEEAAEYLRCGRSTVYVLLDTGSIDSFKIGRLRRIPRSELERYVASQMGGPTEPAASSAIAEVA